MRRPSGCRCNGQIPLKDMTTFATIIIAVMRLKRKLGKKTLVKIYVLYLQLLCRSIQLHGYGQICSLVPHFYSLPPVTNFLETYVYLKEKKIALENEDFRLF